MDRIKDRNKRIAPQEESKMGNDIPRLEIIMPKIVFAFYAWHDVRK